MNNNKKELIKYLESQNCRACITGSIYLDYFENQVIDVFAYDERSMVKILYTLLNNKMFQVLEPLEKWKIDEFLEKGNNSLKKIGVFSIKFKYNLLLDVNIIVKRNADNIFTILSSFDFDLISKGYCMETHQFLDLSNNSTKNIQWNKWNKNYIYLDIWKINRLLRQLDRCIKYHKRGYNTDNVILKYIEIIDFSLNYQNIFNSEKFDERIIEYKKSAISLKGICEEWLKTHEISDEEYERLKTLTKKDI